MKTNLNLRKLLLLAVLFFSLESIFSQSTLVIDTCYWSQIIDCDGDGYASSKSIVVDLQGNPYSVGKYEVWAYKNSGDSILLLPSYDKPYYTSEDDFIVYGCEHSTVKVKVKIKNAYQTVNDIFTFSDSSKFEPENMDVSTNLNYFSWGSFSGFDNDGDSYNSNGILNLTFDPCIRKDTIKYKIILINCDSQSISTYYESPVFVLPSFSDKNVIFGTENGELPEGKYLVKIQVMRVMKNAIIIESLYSDTLKFETKTQDGILSDHFTLSDIKLDSIIDMDKDSCYFSFKLQCNVNIDTGSINNARILITQNGITLSEYKNITISQYNPAIITCKLAHLNNNPTNYIIDPEITVFEGPNIVWSFNEGGRSMLKNICAETFIEDSPFHIKNCSLINVKDIDGDGKPSSGEIMVTFDVISGSDSVYMEIVKVLHKSGGIPFYVFGTEYFKISPSDTVFIVPFNNLSVNMYWSIILHLKNKSLPRKVIDEFREYDSKDLGSEVEPFSEDNFVTINSIILKDSIDANDNGFFSNKTVEVSVSNYPDASFLDFKLSYFNKNSNSIVKTYYISHYEIDSTRIIEFSICLNDNDHSGLYDIKLDIIENVLFENEYKLFNYTLLSNQLLESPSEDIFSIKDAWIDEKQDLDKDGFYSSFNLNFDVDAADTGTYDLRAKLLLKSVSDSIYHYSGITNNFTITSDQSDIQKFTIIVSDLWLSYKYCDIRIELYLGNTLVKVVDQNENAIFNHHPIEYYISDSPFHIKSYSLSNIIDHDGDGEIVSIDVTLLFDVFESNSDSAVRVELWELVGEDPCTLFRSDTFIISPDDTIYTFHLSTDFYYRLPVSFSLYLSNKKYSHYCVEKCYDQTGLWFDYRFENEQNDKSYTINSFNIKDSIDCDGDRYFRMKTFNIDINAVPIPGKVKLCFEFVNQFTNEIVQTIESRYIQIDTFTNDLFSFDIGLNEGKDRGIYKVNLRVVDSIRNEKKLYYTILTNQLLEPSSKDVIQYSISDVNIFNQIDLNRDRFFRSSKIRFNTSVDIGTHEVYGKLFYRNSTDTTFKIFLTTQPFTVTANDTFKSDLILDHTVIAFPHETYDIKFELYKEITDSLLSSTKIQNLKFELASEDVCSFSIDNTYFDVNRIDLDQDGYYQTGNLHYNTTVDLGNHDVVAKILYRGSEDAGYTYFYETPSFMLNGAEEEIFCITIDSSLVLLPHDSYDFKIELFYEDDDSLLAEIGPSDDPYLNDQKFEMEEEDHITSLTEFQSGSIRVFPNPVSSDLTIYLNELTENEFFKVKVYTNQGNLLKEFELKSVSEGNKIAFGDLMPGIYVIQIQSKKYLDYLRIVKY